MELIIAIVAIVLIGAIIYVRNNRAEVEASEQAAFIAVGEPPATVVVPVTESAIVVEGAGVVAVPATAKKAPAKKPAAKKPAAKKPAAAKTAKPKAPAKKTAARTAKPKATAK